MENSVRITSYLIIVTSVIIIFFEIFNLITNPMLQFNILFKSIPAFTKIFDTVNTSILYNLIWSIFLIIFFISAIIGAVQFLRFKKIGRLILEVLCWIGIVGIFINSLINYTIFKNLYTGLTESFASSNNPLGDLSSNTIMALYLGSILQIIPLVMLLIYLKSQKVKILMK